MTPSWEEEPEQQDLDSLDWWAKSSNNTNHMGINANIFPEVYKATCMHAGRGVAFKSSSSEQASRVLALRVSRKNAVAARKRDMVFGSMNRNLVSSLILSLWYASKSPESLFPILFPNLSSPHPSIWLFSSLGEGEGGTKPYEFQKCCSHVGLWFLNIGLYQGMGPLGLLNVKGFSIWNV